MDAMTPALRFLVHLRRDGSTRITPVWAANDDVFLFLVEPTLDPSSGPVEECPDAEFLRMFDQIDRNLSANKHSANYAPGVIRSVVSSEHSCLALERAMDRLLASGVLKIETYGRPSNPHERLARATPLGLFD